MAPTMRAERFYAATKKVALEDVPIPEPGPRHLHHAHDTPKSVAAD